jgi:hypothetical protein
VGLPFSAHSPLTARRLNLPLPLLRAAVCGGQDLTVQLHIIFLNDSDHRRQGLTAQEKQQVLGSLIGRAICVLTGVAYLMFNHP